MGKKVRVLAGGIALFITFGFCTLKNVKASVPDKPSFSLLELKAEKTEVMQGEDIVVNGVLKPNDFATSLASKEIVLVLDVSGSMSGTRITNLKTAANNFITKMREVPNLKIGIVAFSTEATINPNGKNGNKIVSDVDGGSRHSIPNYISISDRLIDISDNRLSSMINNLEPLGGTNTGEGIRKAVYMLKNGEASANKTIILMSDGMPTFYSVKGANKAFYTNIDNINPSFAGAGSGLDIPSVNYAKQIATISNGNKYNCFSIGYELDSIGTQRLKDIHKSMIGSTKDLTSINEGDGFYATSTGAIDGVFNAIADKILDSYEPSNVKMNITFKDGFALNIGGNIVDIGNVTYKKDKIENGRVWYKADPINFSFIIKGNFICDNYELNSAIKIEYPWNGQVITNNFNNKLVVSIKTNDLPKITTDLLSEEVVNTYEEQEVKLKYKVKAENFTFNDMNNVVPNDVAIVLDISNGMNNSISELKSALCNKLIYNSDLINRNTRYGLITFGDTATASTLTSDISTFNKNILQSVAVGTNGGNSNIGNTFVEAVKLLEGNSSRVDARKNIIFISHGNISYTPTQLEQFKKSISNKNYNIITVVTNTSTNNSLYTLHNNLNGVNENYFNLKTMDYSLIESSLMPSLANRIISTTLYKGYDVNPTLNLNLEGNFKASVGVEQADNNTITVKTPTVKYKYTNNNNYVAEPTDTVEFSVVVNKGKLGNLTFGENSSLNYMNYNKILGTNTNVEIKTPIINVMSLVTNVSHGIYGGIEKINGIDTVKVMESSEGFESIAGTNVTFASKFLLKGTGATFNLNVDEKLDNVSKDNIKVYKIIKSSSGTTLQPISAEVSENATNMKCFNITLNNVNDMTQTSESEVIVIYDVKVNKNSKDEEFINKIKFSDTNFKEAKIYTKEKGLPDLF